MGTPCALNACVLHLIWWCRDVLTWPLHVGEDQASLPTWLVADPYGSCFAEIHSLAECEIFQKAFLHFDPSGSEHNFIILHHGFCIHNSQSKTFYLNYVTNMSMLAFSAVSGTRNCSWNKCCIVFCFLVSSKPPLPTV